MRRKTGLALGMALAASVVTANCADSPAPTDIVGTDSFFSHAPLPGFDVLERTVPLQGSPMAAAILGPDGGTLSLPGAGLSLHVPPGALSEHVEITVAAATGNEVAFEFQPHGLRFALPATVEIDAEGTSAEADLRSVEGVGGSPLADYVAVYYEGDPSAGSVDPLEVLPMELFDGHLLFQVHHFSGYASASGK